MRGYRAAIRPADDFFEWLWPATRWVFTEILYLEAFLSRTGVVTPAWEDFPVDDSLEGDALVADYFAFVEAHAGMSDDEVSFEVIARETISSTEILEQMVDQAAEAIKSESDMIETAEPVFIEYEPGLEHDPELLVAVLSRGIADWMCSAHEDSAGGEESFDFAVDLVWVFLGFGVFAASCALRTKPLQGSPFIESGAQRFGARAARAHVMPRALPRAARPRRSPGAAIPAAEPARMARRRPQGPPDPAREAARRAARPRRSGRRPLSSLSARRCASPTCAVGCTLVHVLAAENGSSHAVARRPSLACPLHEPPACGTPSQSPCSSPPRPSPRSPARSSTPGLRRSPHRLPA